MEYSGFYNGDTLYGQEEFNRYFDLSLIHI